MAKLKTHFPVRLSNRTKVPLCGITPAEPKLSVSNTDCKHCLHLLGGREKHRIAQKAFLEERLQNSLKGLCHTCHNPIRVQIFKGTPYCSVDCEKEATG